MKKTAAILLVAALALAGVTAVAKERKAQIAPRTFEIKRSLFSGSETHLHNFSALYSDCTAPAPDIRVVNPPSKGEIRFEEHRLPLANNSSNAVFRLCYGKPVDFVRAYYKANDNSIGRDTLLLDVDNKLGNVYRYKFIVDIR